MKKQRSFIRVLAVAALLTATLIQAVPFDLVNAAQITARKLTLQAGTTDGGSKPSGVVNHFFEFTVPTTGTAIGSIKFEYCTLAAGTCTMPTGLSTLNATLGSEGANAAGFDLINTVGEGAANGTAYLTRTAANPTAGALSYRIDSVTNPSTEGTFFVRISTYTSEDTTGTAIDSGTVNASTAEQIIITGTMPESLVFCTGATVPLTATVPAVPDCANATGGAISFNQLFSPTDTATTNSQMAASTNAGAGYAITVNGPTMTSGSNTITGMSSSGLGVRGISQFGINLKANTALTAASFPGSSAEVAPAANTANYRGQAASGYDTVDNFKFTTGDTVANSYNGSPGGTDTQIFTASYIVNVPGNQPAGTYTTTLTYICTPTF